MIERSMAAFRRDLPQLLKTHPRRWVAYHGDEQLGFAHRQTPLYQSCLERGLPHDQFVVCLIEPAAAEDENEEIELPFPWN
jgi:hypothetical protein